MPTSASARVRRARVSVSAVFTVHGCVAGGFATRIPWLRDHLHLSPGELGLALSFPALGASLTMPLAGRIVHRFGNRAAVRSLLLLLCCSLALPALCPGLPWLCAELFCQGALAGTADVVMNGQGVEVEKRFGRSIMSGLHGMWSAGALIGSGVGVAATHAGLDARPHLAGMAAVLALAGLAAGRGLLDVRPEAGDQAPPRFALPPRSALAIGAVGMCAIFAEGSSMDWSGVYLRDVAHSSQTVAAASFTAFACTMSASRIAGDLAVRRFGPVLTTRAGGVLATLGALLVVVSGTPAVAIPGFALLGIGIAVVIPLAFAAAGKNASSPSQAIAGVATITYATGLLAPAAFGAVADATSLTISFAMVCAAMAVMTLAAGVLRPAGPPAPVPGGPAPAMEASSEEAPA
jgi:MFS family permease